MIRSSVLAAGVLQALPPLITVILTASASGIALRAV